MRRWIFLLLISLGTAWLVTPASAAEAGQVTPEAVEYTFGEQIRLQARIEGETAISEVQAFLRSSGDTETYSGTAVLQDGQIRYTHDLTAEPLRAFSAVDYWFRITPQTGEPYVSETFSFYYEDNRFEWQEHFSDTFVVHWYEGEIDFAQDVLNAAEAGLARARGMLELPATDPVDIYVYASGVEMQSTLRLGGLRWIAGHADPDLGVAVVSLPVGPDQRSEIERQIPHEVMHLLLYQSVGPAYYSLPVWLKEGLASANEMRPNPDYYVILSNAVEGDTLIPMASLCQSFPQDNTVYLAYAQSDSFIRYLYQQHGQTGMQNLLESYAAGQGCETASIPVLGLTLSELEQEWRRTALNDNILGIAFEALLPWSVLLLGILLVPLGMVLASRRRAARPQPAGQIR
jgi:hypothetical protein